MDNVTHTLAGLALAEAALALRRRKSPVSPGLSRAVWLTSALANNVPDLDFAYAGVTEAPYGYLLHHRGHTHTILLAPVMAALAWGLGALWMRRRGVLATGAEHRLLFGVAVLGVLAHIFMDGTNNYGVHPFWPLDDHWYAGDTIFIVEPLFWLVLSIPLALSTELVWGKRVLFGIAGLALVLSVVTGRVSTLALAWLFVGAGLIFLFASRQKSDGARAALTIGLSLVVLLLFAGGRAVAEGRVRSASDGAFPRANEADVILLPEPGNPLCWLAITVSEERGDLVLRRVHASASTLLHPVGLCAMDFGEETTASRTPIVRSENDEVRFVDEVRTPLSALREYAETCHGAAYFQFVRAPFFAEVGEVRWAGDLRYDRETGPSFAESRMDASDTDCPRWLPPWLPPRADVLRGSVPEEEHRHEALDF